MAIIRKGLVEFQDYGWNHEERIRCHVISIHDVGWDEAYFTHSANPYWHQQGTYEKRLDFIGRYGVYWETSDRNEEPKPKKDFRIHVEGLGFFKNLSAYYEFIERSLRGKILEELWEDVQKNIRE